MTCNWDQWRDHAPPWQIRLPPLIAATHHAPVRTEMEPEKSSILEKWLTAVAAALESAWFL